MTSHTRIEAARGSRDDQEQGGAFRRFAQLTQARMASKIGAPLSDQLAELRWTFRTSPMCYAVARPRRKLCRFAIATDGIDDTLCSLFWHGRHSTAHLSKEMCCVSSCVCAVALTCGMRLLRGLGQRPPALARGGPRHCLPGPRGCLSRPPAPPRAGTRPVWPSALVHVKQPALMSHNDCSSCCNRDRGPAVPAPI